MIAHFINKHPIISALLMVILGPPVLFIAMRYVAFWVEVILK